MPFAITRRALLGAAVLAISAGFALAEDKLQVAGIYTVPVEQQWVSRIHKAALAAQERGDIDYVFSENVSNSDYERVMREYAESGKQLVIGEVFAVEQAAREVAADYPEVKWLMGSSFPPDDALPNFAVFDNYIQDASYLTGLAAGALTQSGVIGMVGGFPIPEVNRLMNAFMVGAREVRPDAQFKVAFIGSWFDPPKAKETAFAQMDAGADVMYAERFGVSDAAEERGIPAIGNVIDTAADYPDTIATSAIWHFEPTLDAAIARMRDGSFTAEDYGVYSFMKEGGASITDLTAFKDRVPTEVIDLIQTRQAEIKSGVFVVRVDDSSPGEE